MDVFSNQKLKKKNRKSVSPIAGLMTTKSIFSKDKDNEDEFKHKSKQKKHSEKKSGELHHS